MIKYNFFLKVLLLFSFIIAPSYATTPPTFVTIAKKSLPAVVNISTTYISREKAHTLQEDSFNSSRLYSENTPSRIKSLGSGFIISKDGYVITNCHVVNKINKIIVTTNNGLEYDAKIIGKDARTDIALLKIIPKKKKASYPHLMFASTKDTLHVGEWILAIGNPFGLGGSVTAGIISSKSRDIASTFDLEVASYVDNLIQTDASINAGNSGGPMLNTMGKVVGMNFAILSPSGKSIGVGFAIPASVVQKVAQQLKKYGHVTYGWIGIQVQEITDEIAQSVGLKNKKGAMVISLSNNGPGKKAGLQEGDIILKAGKNLIESYEKFPRISSNLPINKTSLFTIWRNGKVKKLPIFVEAAPNSPEEEIPTLDSPYLMLQRDKEEFILGMLLEPLKPINKLTLQLPEDMEGLVIQQILPFSLGEKADFRKKDVLLKAEGKKISSIYSLKKIIAAAKKEGKTAILIKISRQGKSAYKGINLSNIPKNML